MRIYYGKIDCRAVNYISKDFISAFARFGRVLIILAASMMVAPIVTFLIMPQHFLAGLIRVKICAAAKSGGNRHSKENKN